MIEEKYGGCELSSYEPVELVLPDFEVSDGEVWAEMERVASRHASNVTMEPRGICADDMVQINILTTEDGHPFPGLTHKAVDVQLGVGMLPLEVELALLGHEPGEVVHASFTYEDYSRVASEDGSTDSCCSSSQGEGSGPRMVDLESRIEVIALRALDVPSITDEWVEKNIALSHTVDEFFQRTRRKLVTQRRRSYVNRVEYDVIAVMGERLVDEVPDRVIEPVIKQLVREFDSFLKNYDMERFEYLSTQGLSEEAFLEQVRCDAYERVSQDISLAAYARHEGVVVDDGDIDAIFSQPTPEKTFEARKEAEQSGEIEGMRDLALRMKVAEILTRSAVFRTPDGAVDEGFHRDIEQKYKKLNAVKKHATAKPMLFGSPEWRERNAIRE